MLSPSLPLEPYLPQELPTLSNPQLLQETQVIMGKLTSEVTTLNSKN